MTTDDKKDIVEEVFNRPTKAGDKDSALFGGTEQPSQTPPQTAEDVPSDSNASPACREQAEQVESAPEATEPSAQQQPRPAKYASSKTTSTGINKILTYRNGVIATAAVVLLGLVFFVGRSLLQDGNASTEITLQAQPSPAGHERAERVESALESEPDVNTTETAATSQTLPLPDVELEPVLEEFDKNSITFDKQPAVNWGRLLSEISTIIPTATHLNIIESADGSRMTLEGAALSPDAINSLVTSLNANSQVISAELAETVLNRRQAQGLLSFSIGCFLVPHTNKQSDLEGNYNDSGSGGSILFTPAEAQKFFDSVRPVAEDAGCTVRALLISPEEVFSQQEKTTIIKKQVAFILLGGYQDILKAVEKLQTQPQGVWIDSISIGQATITGELKSSMAISVYIANQNDANN